MASSKGDVIGYMPHGLTMLCGLPTHLNKASARKYEDLTIPCNNILSTYIWIDGTGINMRSKDRLLDFIPKTNKDMPIWIYDGSSTQQAEETNSDVFMYPQVLYNDPFRRGPHLLALCDTYQANYEPTESNHRKSCLLTCEKAEPEEPWFGFQQEFLLTSSEGRPIGWPAGGFPTPPGPYYCAVGANKVMGRDLMDAFYKCCLYAGVKVFGYNPGTAPAQWCFQVGPAPGIKAADDLWMARYIITRLGEEYGVVVNFDPILIPGWPGNANLFYFSTKDMREEDGILVIERAIDNLSRRHGLHMEWYGGADNVRRLNGTYSTSLAKDFTAGVANRKCSVRIPRLTAEDKKGYFEDRRPASNSDPYRLCEIMLRTVVFME